MSSFRKLSVWRKAHALALRVHEAAAAIPERRFPGLPDRLRTCASDLPAAIAEGTWRESPQEFSDCLRGAIACARDLDYRLLLAADLGAIGRAEHVRLSARVEQVCRMLAALRDTVDRRALRRTVARPPGHLT